MQYKNIEIEISGQTGNILLNRPRVKNALNRELIEELISAIEYFNHHASLRFLTIEGSGEMFCSGADLKWMANATSLSSKENYKDTLLFATCLNRIFSTDKITIARVHSGAYGGGAGLVAACDFTFAVTGSVFSFSEVTLGLIPAIIAPYVIRKIGVSKSKELMLTGRKINEQEAKEYGLINDCFSSFDSLVAHTNGFIDELAHTAPEAQKHIKSMLNKLSDIAIDDTIIRLTSKIMAKARLSDEAKEGIAAFLQKRLPAWLKEQQADESH